MNPDVALYRLMTWLSPAFPVGGYAYSHGLETAIDTGLVTDAHALATWIEGLLAFGGLHQDSVLLAATWKAVSANDGAAFQRVAERADTLRGTAELALESRAQGAAFLAAIRATGTEPSLDGWAKALAEQAREPAYCVAVGLAAAVEAVPLRAALTAFLHAGVAAMVSAGVRHVPLGQTQGQRIMADLEAAVGQAVDAAPNISLDGLGTAAVMVDWCSARHETQTVRLYRS